MESNKPTLYLVRIGDGNDGCYPRHILAVPAGGCPYAAARAEAMNQFIPGRSVRRRMASELLIDGDSEHTIYATLLEGPGGATAFGAAWFCLELERLSPEDAEYYSDRLPTFDAPSCWDRGAAMVYRREVASRNARRAEV